MRTLVEEVVSVAWLLLLLPLPLAKAQVQVQVPSPNCKYRCGEVSIDYPFGIGKGCFLPGFEVTCIQDHFPTLVGVDPSKFFLSKIRIPQIEGVDRNNESITKPHQVLVHSNKTMAADCTYGDAIPKVVSIGLKDPFTISGGWNRLIFSGCNTTGYANITGWYNTTDQCRTQWLPDFGDQCDIPVGVRSTGLLYNVNNGLNYSDRYSYCGTDCSHGFLVDKSFDYNMSVLLSYDYVLFNMDPISLPVVVNWAVINGNCLDMPICGSNALCINISQSPYIDFGYNCYCKYGHKGNPYLNGSSGCREIDGTCIDTVGSSSCSCPDGFYRDRIKDRYDCIRKANNGFPVMKVALGMSLGFILLLVGGLYRVQKKRKLRKLKQKYFKQNGGLLLEQQITSQKGSIETIKIFTAQELEKATNNFNESRILGKGGFGTVYKGILPNHRVVAIKKSKIINKTQIEQFVNEVVILSRINHRNVVKLLGCCLDTEVPLLVYEYVSNGTLFLHIHGAGHKSSLSWESRLRIAAETAGALAYLHSAASTPIFHRDVKSANILLDENYAAKVADFGASRFVPLDKAQITTLVQGTLGYLDPEYFHTSHLSDKSDVYSFGVVLVELLTGNFPLSFERSEEERNLAMYFISSMNGDGLFEILEPRVGTEGVKEQLVAVAELAKRCLRLKGGERPTMKDVAVELEGLRRYEAHMWVGKNGESDNLLTEPSQGCISSTTVYDSLLNQEMMLSMDLPR